MCNKSTHFFLHTATSNLIIGILRHFFLYKEQQFIGNVNSILIILYIIVESVDMKKKTEE